MKSQNDDALQRELEDLKIQVRELESTTKRYRSFVRDANEAIYRIDLTIPIPVDLPEKELIEVFKKSAVVGEVNEAQARKFGLKPDEMVGKLVTDFVPSIGARVLTFLRSEQYKGENLEICYPDKVGKSRYFSESFQAIVENGFLLSIWGVQRDITDQKEMEKELIDSEKKLSNVVKFTSNMFFSHTPEHVLTYLSPQVEVMLGYTQEEALVNWTNLVSDNPINEEGFKKTVEAIETGIAQKPYELELIRKDGKKVMLEVREAPVVEKGKTVAIVGAVIDISERKIAEEELRKSHKKFIQAQIMAKLGDYSLDLNTGEVTWSEPLFYMFKFEHSQKLDYSKVQLEIQHPDDKDRVEAWLQDGINAGLEELEPIEFRGICTDGEVKLFLTHGRIEYSEGEAIRLEGTCQDITERRKSEIALRESEEQYSLLFSKMFTGFALHEMIFDDLGKPVDYRFLQVNPAFEKMIGLSAEQVVGKTVLEVLPKTEPHWIETYGEVVRTGTPHRFEHSAQGLDKHFEVVAYSPKEGLFATIFSDITERKLAERALLESEERAKQFSDAAWEAIIIHDDGITISANERYFELFGYEPKDLVGKECLTKTLAQDSVDIVREHVAKGDLNPYKAVGKKKNGTEFPIEVRVRSMEYKGRHVRVASIRDMTDHENAKEELRQSKEHLQSIFRAAPAGIGFTMNRILMEVNDQLCDMVGYEKEEILGKSTRVLYPTDADYEYVGSEKYKQIAEHGTGTVESRWLHKDGSVIDVLIRSTPLERSNLLSGVTFVALDITKRKRAERALLESQGKLLQAQSIARVGDYSYDLETGNIKVSDVLVDILKVDRNEKVSIDNLNARYNHPDDVGRFNKWLLDGIASGQEVLRPIEYRAICTDGEVIYLETKALVEYRNGKAVRVFGTSQDITSRRKTEEALRESEERFRQLSNAAFEAIVIHDKGVVLEANKQYFEMFGYSPEEVIAKECLSKTLDSESISIARQHVVSKDTDLKPHKITGKKRDGTKFPIEVRIRALDYFGRQAQVVAIRDMTENVKAQEALQESEEKLRRFVESFEGVAYQTTLHGLKHILFKGTVEQITGFESKDFTSGKKEWRDIVHPDDVVKAYNAVAELGSNSKKRFAEEYRIIRRDGSICWVRDIGKLVQINGQSMLQGTVVDISARKEAEASKSKLEEQLHQAQKMEAIGQLAGGIAHDFNNQLSSMLGYSDLLSVKLKDEKLKKYAKSIVLSAKRAADLTAQLLAFSRKGKNLSIPVNMRKIISEVVTILERTIDKNVKVSEILKAPCNMTIGDPTQLQNVLLNIVLNACDAMPNGGKLVFETSVEELDKSYSSTHIDVIPGKYLKISITDNGTGMSPEVQKHIFEPFFTTKDVSKGTGMGLASAYGTIRNHKGSIEVYSEEGHGTRISIYLPLSEDVRELVVNDERSVPIVVGDVKILIVDDEVSLRNLGKDILTDIGYEVESCCNGLEAVEYYRENWRDIDLVILDMVMPVMGGREAFHAMKKINPEIKAILSSGFSINGAAQGILNDGVLSFIGKPFNQAEIAREIARILGVKG